ncbi:MAG: hypothetical protein IOD15_01930 [Phycisphaerales bacterium]|nr:hypothetical protein [Phycisphaerales bacterium]
MSSTPTTAPTDTEIALRPAEMHLYKPAEPATAVVTKTEICTAGKKAAGYVRHIEFDVSGTNLVGRAIPGQSIGVLAPGVDAMGKPHKLRLYSLASPTGGEDGQGRILSTTVKRTIDEHWDTHKLFLGVCSNYLCDLQVGDKVQLTGPSGKKFVLPQAAEQLDYLFFATGTGIAPFRGMVMDLLASKANCRVTLVMGTPYATDLLYHEQFTRLAAAHSNFRYLPAISRERNAGPQGPAQHGKLYVQDRLKTDAEELLPLLRSSRTLIYICGIAGMEMGIFQQIATLLSGSDLEQYIRTDAATMEKRANWERSMLHKDIKLSKRIFMEVYA